MAAVASVCFFSYSLYAGEPELSGLLDSTVNVTGGAGGSENSWGIEEYANLRLKVGVGEKAAVYGAINLIALSGNYLVSARSLGLYNSQSPETAGLGYSPFIAGENYAAAMELERLYFRINGDYLDVEAGLLRLAFGYDQVWGSSDFLNPRNPLFPEARPRGSLGASFTHYADSGYKLRLFGAAPEDSLESGGGGIVSGGSALEQAQCPGSVRIPRAP
jgi:hypothetical protein